MALLSSDDVERIFLRLLNCDTDKGLEDLLARFLVPILSSMRVDNPLLTKLQELVNHVNKRLQHRPRVPLPFYQLVELVKQPGLTSFTATFGSVYLKKGYERLDLAERLANVDVMLSCLQFTNSTSTEMVLAVLLRTLKHLRIPNYPDKQEKMVPSIKEQNVADKIFNFAMRVILLSYGALGDKESWKTQPSLYAAMIRGILTHIPDLTSEELEGAKKTLLDLVSCETFNFDQALVSALMVAASADTRCSVSDAAEGHLKKLRNCVDWEKEEVVVLLFSLFLGHDKLPAKMKGMSHLGGSGSLRLRMKLLPTLTLSKLATNLFPLNLQVVYSGLFAEDSNRQLKLSSVQFVHKICDVASDSVLKSIGSMLKQGLLKSVQAASTADLKLSGRVYLGLGKLSTRCPELFSSDVYLLSLLLSMLEQEDKELISDLKEGLFLMTDAYKAVLGTPDEQMLEDLLLKYINKSGSSACCVALRFSNILHPTSHLPSRYLCLLALGSGSNEVVDEARAGIRGSQHDELPDFEEAVKYISVHTKDRLNNTQLCYVMGTQKLPYVPPVFIEVIKFVSKCLEKEIPENVHLERERLTKLREVLSSSPEDVVARYTELLKSALVPAAPGDLHLHAMELLLQLYGALPEHLTLSFPWAEVFLTGSLPGLRAATATLVGLAARRGRQGGAWGLRVLELVSNKRSTYEVVDGSLLVAGYLVSSSTGQQLMNSVVHFLASDHSASACSTIYNAACSHNLEDIIGSESLTKLHQQLITMISQTKEQKVLISLTRALGSLHLHNSNLRLDQTLNTICDTSKLNLLELNFSTGKILAVMSSGGGSAASIPDVFINVVPGEGKKETETTKLILRKIIREFVLGDVRDCQIQGAAIWILSLLKYSSDVDSIKGLRSDIQHALSVLLSSKDNLTQEIASEALALLYATADTSSKSHLIDMLKATLLNETVPHKHVARETQIFSPEDLGKLPSSMGGGNLTTYKELCSLASDMNQPEMIYQFMHLSNHSSIWNDKIGAAFGVGHLVKSAGKELEPYLAKIIPRLYRYIYDPNLKVQQSMSNIWSIVVPRPSETVDTYLTEIIRDIKDNIHHRTWRTRESCSNALGDLVRTRSHNDIILSEMPEFWILILKLMDDVKESVRMSATKTAEILSKISCNICNLDNGTRGSRGISTILPVLLEHGITSSLTEVQTVSIVTVMKISENAGKLLAPHVHVIIPAFVVAAANIEPKAFGHVTTMVSGDSADKDKLEAARATLALTSPLISVIEKCVRCVGAQGQLEVLVPKLASLAKSSVGLTPRVTLLHTVSLLAVYKQQDLTPWVGKLMAAMFVVLQDRSSAVRDKCAATIAVLFRYAKPSTVDNVLEKLRVWYLEKEDHTRLLVAATLFKISNSAPDVLRTVHQTVVPLILFGKHSKDEAERGLWETVWLELGVSDQAVILSYLTEVSGFCENCLRANSWTNRVQGAETLTAVAKILGSEYPVAKLTGNASVLLEVTTGRTFAGKSAILSAISKTLVAPNRANLSDLGVSEDTVVNVFLKEINKSDPQYVSDVMRSFGDLLLKIEISDRWDEIWDICSAHLMPKEDSEGENEENKEKKQKTQAFSIQTLVQESAILLVGISWAVCRTKSSKIIDLSQFLSGTIKICTWKIQSVVICTIQRVLETLKEQENSIRVEVYEICIPSLLRCVDDAKHLAVRGLALKLITEVFSTLKKDDITVGTGVLKDVLLHVRDQISVEGNHNLKAMGIEIVTMVEKHFIVN